MSVKKIRVDCLRGGQLLKSYELGLPIGLMPGIPPNNKELEMQAMEALTNERIAFPPYEGITFKIRHS